MIVLHLVLFQDFKPKSIQVAKINIHLLSINSFNSCALASYDFKMNTRTRNVFKVSFATYILFTVMTIVFFNLNLPLPTFICLGLLSTSLLMETTCGIYLAYVSLKKHKPIDETTPLLEDYLDVEAGTLNVTHHSFVNLHPYLKSRPLPILRQRSYPPKSIVNSCLDSNFVRSYLEWRQKRCDNRRRQTVSDSVVIDHIKEKSEIINRLKSESAADIPVDRLKPFVIDTELNMNVSEQGEIFTIEMV